jgi:Bacterial transcriptional activator domain
MRDILSPWRCRQGAGESGSSARSSWRARSRSPWVASRSVACWRRWRCTAGKRSARPAWRMRCGGTTRPRTAAKTLQNYVLRVRRALARAGGGIAVVTQAGGYCLRAGPGAVDAILAENLIGTGRAEMAGGDPAAAARLLRQALDLWRGPALGEFGRAREMSRLLARIRWPTSWARFRPRLRARWSGSGRSARRRSGSWLPPRRELRFRRPWPRRSRRTPAGIRISPWK